MSQVFGGGVAFAAFAAFAARAIFNAKASLARCSGDFGMPALARPALD